MWIALSQFWDTYRNGKQQKLGSKKLTHRKPSPIGIQLRKSRLERESKKEKNIGKGSIIVGFIIAFVGLCLVMGSSSWRRTFGNVRSFVGNSMGGLRGGTNLASWVVAGTLAYFLWVKPSQDLKREQQVLLLLHSRFCGLTQNFLVVIIER